MRIARVTFAALALASAAISTAACNATTYTSNCSNDSCTVSLSGVGAEAEVGTTDTPVSLDGAADGEASFTVNGESATCVQGEELTVGGIAVTCTEVGDNKVTLEMR